MHHSSRLLTFGSILRGMPVASTGVGAIGGLENHHSSVRSAHPACSTCLLRLRLFERRAAVFSLAELIRLCWCRLCCRASRG